MDTLPYLKNIAWCKEWSYPSITNENKEFLKQCADIPALDLCDDIEEIIEKSKAFLSPFSVDTIRLHMLKARKPIEKLKRNVTSTYPVVHERVIHLMAQFLKYKRNFGSDIEKALYREMTIPNLIDRILKKRAISFVGPRDRYLLITGETGVEGWEQIGTPEEEPPLLLENCLSYDELKLSAMVYVSGYTACINDGTRRNRGVVCEDNIEEEAVIIGLIGPRFHRRGKMDYEDIIVTKEQNCPENGYGKEDEPTSSFTSFFKQFTKDENRGESEKAKFALREMWSEFYQSPSIKFKDIKDADLKTNQHIERFTSIVEKKLLSIFDNEVYYKRICILAETTLIEAEHRAKESGRNAFVNVIGCGLGVWLVSNHQADVYILTFLDRISALLKNDLLNHITDVNFAYIKPSCDVEALFVNVAESSKQIFLESESHPKCGINVQLENREPSSRLVGEHSGKLLVMTYPWDSNAHPGNEFWYGNLHTSGDPAAACSTQVSELHNAYINPAVGGANVRVAGRAGLVTLADHTLDMCADV